MLDRLGVGYEVLKQANPALVYCPITGYGQDGPNRDRAGHDMNYLGLNGLLGLTGEKGGPAIQPAGQIADLGGGGLMAALGILAALNEAKVAGEGQMVDISMYDGAQRGWRWSRPAISPTATSPTAETSSSPGRSSATARTRRRTAGSPAAPSSRNSGPAWCRGVGREDLIEHQFEPPGSEAHAQAAEIFRSRTREEWRAFNDEHDCCVEPVLDLDEALGSEQAGAREMVVSSISPGSARCASSDFR